MIVMEQKYTYFKQSFNNSLERRLEASLTVQVFCFNFCSVVI